MIIAERKPVNEIVEMVKDAKRVLVLGCRGCVSVCSAGGEREVELLSSLIRLGKQKQGQKAEVIGATLVRQCDKEYVDEIDQWQGRYDAIVSMACGVGVNFIANLRPNDQVFPAVNTTSFGGSAEQGVWSEQCAGCGDCVLHLTGGLCPVARCAKSLMNGPCGGSVEGRCEIHQEVPCIWQFIHERLNRFERRQDLERVAPIRDWRSAGHGGPRKTVRDDLTV
ncbi:methylenetetrahydrofolate reductase C-terminal domain-containing protein [Desulfurivibrio dismutans]|uniref:methylenetetrahydrofolate reductase C-terminal domain-containing protein n=1 Tax=Desulfurivibrio dismutans TaxID=1398908 RepID=UPI0023DB2C1E|nr:methylenetetrahydrofolate reductase C-terminal domain-containing protein [Desulfurivibrio alkaliphilus]MDF1615119.1 methylenetetrahydrofolate reductase C-terminal domain-containing protein [Desulfurivibrio alkaliphilus]